MPSEDPNRWSGRERDKAHSEEPQPRAPSVVAFSHPLHMHNRQAPIRLTTSPIGQGGLMEDYVSCGTFLARLMHFRFTTRFNMQTCHHYTVVTIWRILSLGNCEFTAERGTIPYVA